ncbi:glycosyltransferase [Tropicibacter sp. S64]|uniref:glycosyltransferase n=1 Tax=Tropicibacter sp. S64 TaxID=3415122 RepID=UPI003C7B5750
MTQRALQSFSGTEMYTAEIARALKARGHEVAVYCPLPGKIANLITPSGIPVKDRLESLPFMPEVIHGHHHLPLMAALAHFDKAPAIHVWHGTRPWVEQVPRHPRIIRYVVTSARMAPRVTAEFGVGADRVRVVPNFVDTLRYSHVRSVAARPTRAVLFGQSGFYAHELAMLEKACTQNGLTLDKVGYAYGNPRPRPEYFLPDYDIAFAVGRSALEAMASGCAVIPIVPQLAGQRITAATLESWAASNYSPRYFTGADRFDTEWMARQLAAWDAADIAEVTAQVRRGNTLERGIDQFEALYGEAIREPRPAGGPSDYAGYLAWMTKEADALWLAGETHRTEMETMRRENARLTAELARLAPQSAPAPVPVPDQTAPLSESEAALHERIRASGLFDPAWYRQTYADVARSGQDPLTHYLRSGWTEGRNPSAYFDGPAYLAANPDLLGRQVSPLEHYLGKLERLTATLRQGRIGRGSEG